LGEAQLNAANAIDALIDQNLAMKAPPGVKNFQSKLSQNLAEARKKIAQSYVVEKALNDATGNVSARMLSKEKGLTGRLADVGEMYKAFEKQMRDVDKLPGTARESISNMDVAKGLLMKGLDKGTLGAASVVGRMAAKPLLLSDWYQAMNVGPQTYQPGLGVRFPAQALNNPYAPLLTIPRPPQEQE
jgi:hypothetical protein